jgi:hypothetical protein
MIDQFQAGDRVVVLEGPHVYQCKVTKVARRYVSVGGSHRSFDFDKHTRAHRGDHCGYVPNLYTPDEHERMVAWDEFVRAFRSLPYGCPAVATREELDKFAAVFRRWAQGAPATDPTKPPGETPPSGCPAIKRPTCKV